MLKPKITFYPQNHKFLDFQGKLQRKKLKVPNKAYDNYKVRLRGSLEKVLE